jgi:hypothetical protein
MTMAVIGTLALLPAAAQAGQIWFGGMDVVIAADREQAGQEPRGTYGGGCCYTESAQMIFSRKSVGIRQCF